MTGWSNNRELFPDPKKTWKSASRNTDIVGDINGIKLMNDTYDAMTENRVYQKATDRQSALAEIKRNAGYSI